MEIKICVLWAIDLTKGTLSCIFVEKHSEEYRKFGSQALTITRIFCIGFFTLAIDSYKVFSTTVLVTPWGSTNKVQCRADNGSRYASSLSCFICK